MTRSRTCIDRSTHERQNYRFDILGRGRYQLRRTIISDYLKTSENFQAFPVILMISPSVRRCTYVPYGYGLGALLVVAILGEGFKLACK